MIVIRSFSGAQPLPALDIRTGSNRVAAEEASARAETYGTWSAVQVNFGDGSRPLSGLELKHWVERHYPKFCERSNVPVSRCVGCQAERKH